MTTEPQPETRYRKLPIEVDARQLHGSDDGEAGRDLAAWCGGWLAGTYREPKLIVPTLEGDMAARVGDWIVKGVRGEFHPVRADIFAETYEPAAVSPPPATDRAALLAEAIARVEGPERRALGLGWEAARDVLLRMADEVEPPLSPDYEHPACGFHWYGKDGMDIPLRDGEPVCPRCELARVEKLLAHRERRCEELRTESRRRGRNVLEGSEKVRALERQIDGVRTQLGAEILRTGQAEAELHRLAAGERDEQQECALCGHRTCMLGKPCGVIATDRGDLPERCGCTGGEEQQAETQAHPAEHTWTAELRDPLAEEWAPGTRYVVRERAVDALAHARRLAPTWTDGTPTERRLVRATTTYTVEPAAAPVARQSPADTTGDEAQS